MPVSKMKFLIHRISFSTSSAGAASTVDPKNLDKTNLPKNNTEKQITINMDKKDNQGNDSDSGIFSSSFFLAFM